MWKNYVEDNKMEMSTVCLADDLAAKFYSRSEENLLQSENGTALSSCNTYHTFRLG